MTGEPAAPPALHHVELWTADLALSEPAFHWLLTELGWVAQPLPDWPQGRVWTHPSGTYLVLEQSPALTGPHERTRAGLNHLALNVDDRGTLDRLRAAAGRWGWSELFGDRYPHAGGADHTALFLTNGEGFEVELVAP